MKTKQILCILLIFCCILGGCSKNNAKDTTATSKGRYVEKTISLPEGVKIDNTFLTKKDNKPFLYKFNEAPSSITGYQLTKDGTWAEATPAWLKSLTALPAGWSFQAQILEDSNGYQYLYYNEPVKESSKGNLLRSKDGTTYETLKPEGWDEIDPAYGTNGGYKAPSKVTILGDGTLAALFYSGEAVIYDSEKYKIKSTINQTHYNESFLSSVGNKLILGESDARIAVKAIDVYDPSNNTSVSYPFESTIASYYYCDTKDQDILLCNSDGIYKLENGTSVWNCVVDGTLTSLAMPTMWINGFISDNSNNYYVLFGTDAGPSLKEYSFDPTVNSIPSKELKIYSLKDNSTLRQAIALFQQKHTDVKVNLTAAMSNEEYSACDAATKEDYIRALNTELLADDSYDILVLDELPATSFIEKGVLTDISDIMKPMINDGTLLKNIMDNYLEKDKYYRVPVRFSLNYLFGVTSDTQQLTTLKAMAEYASTHMDTPLFGSLAENDLVHSFVPYQISSLLDENGKINRDKLIEALTILKQLYDNSKTTDKSSDSNAEGAAKGADNYWNMVKGNYLTLNSVSGFLDAMFPFGLTTYLKRSYAPFENSFIPICELGIISKGKQIDLSKEFLKTVLSEEVLATDFYDGFPVNAKALVKLSSLNRSGYASCTDVENADGTTSLVTFDPLNEQQLKEVIGICSSVNNRIYADRHIINAIEVKGKEFFAGNQSVSDAADTIIEEMNIYLTE